MSYKLFPESVSPAEVNELADKSKICKGNILTMTTLSASGHPGGSMSSIDILLTLYKYGNLSPEAFDSGTADNMVVSIGHISPAVYSCLAVNGFFPADDAISQFRLTGSIYEGHIERAVRGIEWTTGNLGQGLSAACGMALAAKIKGESKFTYVLMGDGEQQKGQQAEAKRFAVKHKLNKLIAFIDYNRLQISGNISSVMTQDIASEYSAAGWAVYHVNGHKYADLVTTIRDAQEVDSPAVIIANTTMGHGVSFMENLAKYHGSTLSAADYEKAMTELGLPPVLDKYKEMRKNFKADLSKHILKKPVYKAPVAERKYYAADASTDCRSAYGDAVERLVKSSENSENPVIVFDCDLAGSVKTNGVEKNFPEKFVQSGISEHHAAAAAGAASVKGITPFFSTFAMFAVDEVYNQLRMNDINNSNLKVATTHAGVDVGEDGKTHQCIDYLGLLKNIFTFNVICPADPNQTDAAILHAASMYGNYAVIMGRSKIPVITDEKGKPFFGEGYKFEYGKIDEIRKGNYPLLSYGSMLYRAVEVKNMLEKDGISIGVYNVSTPVHPDRQTIIEMAKKGKIFVLEDHISKSGLYSTVCEIIASEGIACKIIPFGVDHYAYSGTPEQVFELLKIDSKSVADSIKKIIK